MAGRSKNEDLERAYDAFDDGRYEAALGDAEAALKTTPKDRDAWLLKAACLDALGDAESALSEYEALTEQFPDDAEVWVRLADLCHLGMGDVEMAIEALTTALEIAEPDDPADEGDEEMAF